jgi:hypothetical protein
MSYKVIKTANYIITERRSDFRVKWLDETGEVQYFTKSYDTFLDVDDLALWLDEKYSFV